MPGLNHLLLFDMISGKKKTLGYSLTCRQEIGETMVRYVTMYTILKSSYDTFINQNNINNSVLCKFKRKPSFSPCIRTF